MRFSMNVSCRFSLVLLGVLVFIEVARGIAEAQRIINSTLTVNYLQHEAINAQLKMAASPNHTTVYIPSGANGIPLVGTLNQH